MQEMRQDIRQTSPRIDNHRLVNHPDSRKRVIMKFGMRTPSLKHSLKARTTSKWKRQVKKAIIPGYGKKGAGWVKNPRKAAYNKVYRKTSFSFWDLFK